MDYEAANILAGPPLALSSRGWRSPPRDRELGFPDESHAERLCVWGAQAASLQVSAAC